MEGFLVVENKLFMYPGIVGVSDDDLPRFPVLCDLT
jgi:hypothetical protein